MPFVPLSTPTGPLDVHYNISTPMSRSSPTIAPKLPCILFLHAGYVGQEVFETQFCDPQLRKNFNLIAMDMRGWGLTKGSVGTDSYSPTDSAGDVCGFLKALNLPPLHIFGLSIGGCVALEVATSHPEMILSLIWCSPLPATEPEDIAAGRQEVRECFVQAYDHGGGSPAAPVRDKDMFDDVIRGAQELCFNNQSTSLTDAITRCATIQARHSRAGTAEKLAESYLTSIGWFLNRRPLSRQALSKITCPICLVHCSDDIAYPLHYARGVEAQLRGAGIADVMLYQVPGPHYGHVTNPQAINLILHDIVLSVSHIGDSSTSRHLPPSSSYQQHHDYPKLDTPFTKQLAKYGYDPEEKDSDSDI